MFVVLFFSITILINPCFFSCNSFAYASPAHAHWKSIFAQESKEVSFLDLTTQKGGTGLGEPSPPFTIGEIVELIAHLTCGGDPTKDKLVAFEVIDPNNETILVRSQITDHDGVATIEFEIPALPESFGTWKVIAVSKACDTTAWDFLYFTVKPPAIGGHATPIEKTRWPVSQTDMDNIPANKIELLAPYIGLIILLAVAAVTVVYVKKRKRNTETNS